MSELNRVQFELPKRVSYRKPLIQFANPKIGMLNLCGRLLGPPKISNEGKFLLLAALRVVEEFEIARVR